jgi:hypothetical protein
LSTKLVIVTGVVVLGFDTCTVNVNDPPGATSLAGEAALVTAITGTGVNVTVACAVAVTVVPLFIPVTVTVSVCDAPAAPVNGPVNEHGLELAPGASVVPINAPHVLPGRVDRSPYTLSTKLVILIGSTMLGFDTCTVNVNVPPGATSLTGAAAFVTAITGAGNATDSFAAPHALDTGA